MNRIPSIALLLALLLMAGCAAPATTPATTAAPPIVIGVPTDLGTIEGQDALNSALLAVDEINAKGGVNVGGAQRLLQIESIDTREAGAGIPVNDALQAVEKLILEKEPDAIVVGAFRSEVLMASLDLIAKYKIPYLVTIAATPALQQRVTESYDSYKYFFRLGLNGSGVGMYLTQAMGFLAQEFNFSRAYLTYQDVAWAKGTADGVAKWLTDNGWEVVGNDAYPIGATEFSTSLSKAIDGKADVIMPIFDMPQAGILLKQARSMQAPALLAGFISPVAPATAWETFEGDVDGMVNLMFEIGPLPVQAVPASVQFNDNYAKKFGEEARAKLSGHGPGPSYDAVYVLAAAIERAGTLDGDALVTALEATDMQGVIGRIKFGEDHQVIFGLDPKETALGVVFQWRDGKRIPVFPPAVAEGEIEVPASE
ncbi:MAG TPA: ABC transporter substrate-binding protein [Anaerolineae bacterium]|nr:ABC transporter substrate-binding protein [Anaerolineae bacterium]